MDKAKLNRLRNKATSLFREREALLVFSHQMTPALRQQLEKARAGALTIPKLKELIATLQAEIAELRQLLGCRTPTSELVDLLGLAEVAPKGKSLYITKCELAKLFGRYDQILADFGRLPDHANVHIRPFKERPGQGEWSLLEATLFEDTCALFNLATLRQTAAGGQTTNLKQTKTIAALFRAAANVAIYTLEAYLNGLACDCLLADEDKLSEEVKGVLQEWDVRKNRSRHLSLRDKLLQYPKIVLDAEHPPLQESNSPEIEFIVGKAKLLRDAVVHPSPRSRSRDSSDEREVLLMNLDHEETGRVADSVVSLIRKIEMAVRGSPEKVFWLVDRGPDGLFPDVVFE